MSPRFSRLLGLGLLVVSACAQNPPPATEETSDLATPMADLAQPLDRSDLAVLRPSCDVALGGPELPPGSTEGKPDFDKELGAVDLTQLPATLDLLPSSELSRGVARYLLGRSLTELGDSIDKAAALTTSLGRVVVASFAVADPQGLKGVDLSFLRRGLHRYYHCDRAYPLTLSGFRQTVWDYTTATGRVVTSAPKAGPRRLYENAELGVYVAETLVNDEVRETEMQLTKSRSDGAHDFLAYDHSGLQVRTSTFAAGSGNMRVAASPYTCMACHYDKTSKTFNAVVPN